MLYGAMNFPVRPILKEFDSISELGFDFLELTMDPPQAHYTMIRKEMKSILKALDRYSMKIICHLPTTCRMRRAAKISTPKKEKIIMHF